jgi:NAD(P)-dependent dehydrogenase (short-subunit alcohol dehydrogenase family)
MGRLEGKVAVITGAAGGIGSAAARRFVAEGANVLLVDREVDALKRLIDELSPVKAAYFAGDVTDEAATQVFVAQATDRFGRVDVALLNAGIEGEVGRIGDASIAMFDRVMAVNVRSVWLGLAALIPVMRKTGGGSIIITSSVAGVKGSPKLAAYSTSKHAVVGMMKSAASECISDRIRVNAICPGQTRTRLMDSIDEMMRAAGRTGDPTAAIPMGRYADPSEIVSMMLYLGSDESSYCTGATYLVDGGRMS